MKRIKDSKIYLEQIIEYCLDIESYIDGVLKINFLQNKEKQDAVVRKIEVIGEIVKRLPAILKESSPNIPWKDISGMRDILIHDYAFVDLSETWKVARVDIPKLKRQVIKILKNIGKKEEE